MKKRTTGIVLLVMLICSALLSCQPAAENTKDTDTLFQYSTLGSLMAGVYDGDLTFGELKQYGDLGLGTFNTLDGEMIEIEGKFYQVKADGVAYEVSDETKTPFAVVTFFEADQTVKVSESMSCEDFKTYINSLLPSENLPYAIKASGTFSYLKTRSVPAQEEPYPPLLDVLADQPTFEFENVEGDMLGFRLPVYMDVANAPGYHFHFINAERNAGGHVLDCTVQDVTLEIDYTDTWHTELPSDDAFYDVNMSDEKYQ